jgi:hypothetical protein
MEARNVHLRVYLTLYSAALAWSTARVEDDLGIHASEEDETHCPICIPEDGATQEDHLDVDGGSLSVTSDGSVELVHVGIWTVAFDYEWVERTGAVLGCAKISESRGRVTGLEVGFPIEVLGFDKGDVLVLGGSAYKDVRGDRLVVHDFHKVADADVLPEGLGPVYVWGPLMREGVGRAVMVELDGGVRGCGGLGVSAGTDTCGDDAPDEGAALGAGEVWVGPAWTREDSDGGVVHATVRLMALDVFVSVLYGGDAEDDDDGEEDEAGRDGGELWEELENGNEEEEAVDGEDGDRGERGDVHVGDATELLEEVAGEKCDDGVL